MNQFAGHGGFQRNEPGLLAEQLGRGAKAAGILPQPAPATDLLEQQGRLFIDAHCSSRPVVCESGEFRTLRTQLQELETQEARLRQDARRFGTSPELLREQARLITLKASVTRELVQLLIS